MARAFQRLETADARAAAPKMLTPDDLLSGSRAVHTLTVPAEILAPSLESESGAERGTVQIRPLSVGTLSLISRAAREDIGLIPLLTIKEALVEPSLTLDQVKRLHIGLVHFLVSRINQVSGLDPSGDTLTNAVESGYGRAHLLLARHFGWTPEQVAQLTPGQVAVYLAGIERLLEMERGSE